MIRHLNPRSENRFRDNDTSLKSSKRETMDPISMTITNPNYRMDIISLTLATGVFKKFFLHLYETYCFPFKLFEGTTNAVRWKR